MREYLFLIEYIRNEKHYILPSYHTSELRARAFAVEWGERIHVEIVGVEQASQWVLPSGAVLLGEINIKE